MNIISPRTFDGPLSNLADHFPAIRPYVQYLKGANLGNLIANYVSDDVYTNWAHQAKQAQWDSWPRP